MITKFAALIPKSLQKRSGSVFFSGRIAFGSPSKLYVLGLNPGGPPDDREDRTVEWHTNKVLTVEKPDWSAYRDEQ